MSIPFVILTGISGVGKTTIAQAIEDSHPEISVYQGDRIGLPPEDILAGYGHTDEPGGPTQRGFALYWIGRIHEALREGKPTLLETQCRIAFLVEALALHGVKDARIVLVECPDSEREKRLTERGHPELANEQMSNWGRFLHRESENYGLEVMDTNARTLAESVEHILGYLVQL